MKKTIKLQDVLLAVRENGHLGYIKIIKPKKQPDVSDISISISLFKKKYVDKQKGDEILNFDNKELNITELESILTRYIGDEVSIFAGNMSFTGVLVDFKSIKKEIGITDNDISKMFGYKSKMAYANSSAKTRIENGLVNFYTKIKRVDG